MNQMHNHIDREFTPSSDRVLRLISEKFEQSKPDAIESVADLPWKYDTGGVHFRIPASELSNDQQALLERVGFYKDRWDGYALEGHPTSHDYSSKSGKVWDDLRESIARKIREDKPIANVTDALMELPWMYDNGRNIVLDAGKLSPEEVSMIKEAIPEIYYRESFKGLLDDYDGQTGDKIRLFELVKHGSFYIARSVFDKPYYEAFQPIAEQNLADLIGKVSQLPWQENDAGQYQINHRDLTRDQQIMLKQVPEDFFDHDAERANRDPFSNKKTSILDPNAKDNRLVNAIDLRSQSNDRGR